MEGQIMSPNGVHELTYEFPEPEPFLPTVLEVFATYHLVVGLLISLVATIMLMRGPRRYLAIASLVCLAVVAFDVASHGPGRHSTWTPFAVIALFGVFSVSNLMWPSASRWVNWPFVTGCVSGTTFFIAAWLVG